MIEARWRRRLEDSGSASPGGGEGSMGGGEETVERRRWIVRLVAREKFIWQPLEKVCKEIFYNTECVLDLDILHVSREIYQQVSSVF